MEELFSEGYVNSNIYGTLGYFYIANNELEKAIDFAKEATAYNDADLVSLDNLGQANIMLGNLDEAQAAYDKAFEKSADKNEGAILIFFIIYSPILYFFINFNVPFITFFRQGAIFYHFFNFAVRLVNVSATTEFT